MQVACPESDKSIALTNRPAFLLENICRQVLADGIRFIAFRRKRFRNESSQLIGTQSAWHLTAVTCALKCYRCKPRTKRR